ncbi:MAG: DUF488 family protein [Lapillicoccus sp.]
MGTQGQGSAAFRPAAADDEAGPVRVGTRAYRTEMARPGPRHLIELLAALSRRTDLSVGCYCKDEARCHRSVLRALLDDAGAT